MSIRKRIAFMIYPEAREALENYRESTDWTNERMTKMAGRLESVTAQKHILRIALGNIVAMRTPNCASIGKRMADVAAEALK